MNVLDIARGAYARSPVPFKRAVAPILSLAPASLKYGRAYRRTRERIVMSAADAAFADAEQLRALRALLAKAHAGSPFWRDRLDRALGRIDFEAAGRDHLASLPILTKNDLTAAGASALAVPEAMLDRGTTSGSNGEPPFVFWRDKDRSVREIAFINHIWSRTGYTETSRRAVLRGIRLDNAGRTSIWDPALRELKLAVFPMREADVAHYIDLIDRHEVRYLNTYPSALEIFCRVAIAIGRRPLQRLKGIFPISEPVYPHQRTLVAQALGAVPIVPFYGLGEKSAFAGEIAGEPGTYEFEPLYGIAELVDDDGRIVTVPGQEGRLVGTGFVSTGMPFIRYDSGDRAVLVETATAGNGHRLRVRNITPRRKPDHLVAADGSRVVTTDFTPEDPAFFRSIREIQFYQERPGEVIVRYIPSELATPAHLDAMRTEFVRRAEGRINFTMEACETIFASSNGKRAFIDQRIG